MATDAKRPGIALRLLAAAATACLFSCEAFEFSPFQARLEPDARGLTRVNLQRLAASDSGARSFRFAVLADIQYDLDDLAGAVEALNADSSLRFVLILGDLTQFGMRHEFLWVQKSLSRLSAPVLTALGNHDAQANGLRIYRDMFGPVDYAFAYRGVRFLIFNSNVWEFPCCIPDYSWLQREVDAAGDSVAIVAAAHIPPFGDQFDSRSGEKLAGFLARSRVRMALFGHQHNWHFHEHYGDGVPYLVVDDVGGRNYAVVTVREGNWSVERVFF